MVLETERLILRPWKKEDVESLFSLAKDPNVGTRCGWTPHKSLRESKAVLRDVLMNEYTFALVLKTTQEVIGNIALMPYCESRFAQNEMQAEIGFWLGYSYWKKGYMTEACQRMLTYAWDELKLEKIWCVHDLDNIASMRVQEKCGFCFERNDVYYSKEQDKQVCIKVNSIKQEEKRG